MYILGLNVGHNGTACLLKDGKIIGCVSEERFTRLKNHSGIPYKSIAWLLKEHKITPDHLALVVLDNNYSIMKDPDFGKRFHEAYTKKPFKKRVLSKLGYSFPNLFRNYLSSRSDNDKKKRIERSKLLRKKISKVLRIPEKKVKIIDHHYAHALATCFNLPKNKKTLVFTLDGEGNGLCASVNVFDGKSMQVISRTDKSASLGYLYSLATVYLGMKPLQHEFKVMGLAPYAKQHAIDKIYNKFDNLIKIDSKLRFQSKFNMPFSDHFYNLQMRNQRFDTIAGAVQQLVEQKTCEWILSAIRKTGIKDIALSGGVFMNVKANMKISELSEVKSLFVMPSCGDESNAIGACFHGYQLYCKKNGLNLECKEIDHLYLGPEYSESYVSDLIKREKLDKKYIIKKPKNINLEIAKLLSKGNIVARCSGKSEWGARALGNRSILANPKDSDTIRILNETIKDRDFWMPFTPSMLSESAKSYIVNPKNIKAKFMAITFQSKKLAQLHLPAAMHPYDFTVRPQLVNEKDNPDYHSILKNFKKLTGTSAILNTSFNLHGEPNVLTPEDALRTVENSDLNYLALGNFILKKRKPLYT